jgi:hypothetical protein
MFPLPPGLHQLNTILSRLRSGSQLNLSPLSLHLNRPPCPRVLTTRSTLVIPPLSSAPLPISMTRVISKRGLKSRRSRFFTAGAMIQVTAFQPAVASVADSATLESRWLPWPPWFTSPGMRSLPRGLIE